MKNSQILNITKWLMLVIAYVYLGYRLWEYDDYESLVHFFGEASVVQYLWGIVAIILMPLNLSLESWKWKTLLANIYPMSFVDATRQVYYGFVGAFITPFRAGDYPTRVMLLRDKSCWKEAIGMGIYGSLILTIVIVLMGWLPAIQFLGSGMVEGMQMYVVSAGVMFLILCVLPWVSKYLPRLRSFFNKRTYWIFGQSWLRYVVFCIQLYAMLRCVNVDLSIWDACMAIPVYYLLVTLTPNMPIADAGIRGSWAVFVFSRYADSIPQIALAAIGCWFVNTILPLLIGSRLGQPHQNRAFPFRYHVSNRQNH